MKSFDYVIKDPVGIHARPAGLLVKKIKEFAGTTITLIKGDKMVDARKLMAIMQMGIKQHDTVTVQVEGENEEAVCQTIKEFFEANL